MELIIGGAYQGKLRYALDVLGIEEIEVYHCGDAPELDKTKRCIYGYEKYLRACLRSGREPETVFRDDAVVICQDISCGIVSIDAEERQWRELCGRTVTALAARADSVTRIFCGLPQKLK